MTRFEDELKNALQRQEVPDGFAERVLARAAGRTPRPVTTTWRDSLWNVFAQPLFRWAAVAAVSVALVVGAVHYRNVQRERAQGEAAKEQLLLALRIAGSKLQLARAKVDQINSDQTNSSQTENQQERE
jgi:anti-sigma-K factor RskA